MFFKNFVRVSVCFFVLFWLCWFFVAAQVFLYCDECGLLSSCMHGLLISEASFVVEHELQAARASAVAEPGLRNCPSWALEHRCTVMSSLHRPGIKPVSPALVGGFLTTRPAGKSCGLVLID